VLFLLARIMGLLLLRSNRLSGNAMVGISYLG